MGTHHRFGLVGVILGALPALATPVAAEVGLETPEEIVVVAHKSERPLGQIAANVSVLTRQGLRRDLSADLADALRYLPGIEREAAGSRFGTEGISIRGIGGNRVALLVDGVPLGERFAIGSFGNATRALLDAGLIERVEVLHGPASALYGSDAVGGVLALVTPDPADVTRGAGAGLTGSTAWRSADDSLHGSGTAAFGDDALGLLLAGSLRDGHAATPAALAEPLDAGQYRRRVALLKVTARDGGGRAWRAGILHQDQEAATDLRSLAGHGRFATTTALTGADTAGLDLAWAELGFGPAGRALDTGVLRAWASVQEVDQQTADVRTLAARPVSIERRFRYRQRARGLELDLEKTIGGERVSHRLAYGLELRSSETEEWRDALETGLSDGRSSRIVLGEVFPLRDFPISRTTRSGAWLEDTMDFGDLHVIAGLRADRYELSPRPDAVYASDNPAAVPVALTETDLSPKLGAVIGLSGTLDAYAQYAHGFRAPPAEDANIGLDIPLFNIRAVPNPGLRSERSDGIDAGLRWHGERAHARIGVFRNEYRDFIETKVPLGADPATGRLLFQSRNLSRARIEGVEAGFGATLGGWSVDASLYAARGENLENGQPLESVGPAKAVAGVTWQPGGDGPEWRLVATAAGRAPEANPGAGLFRPPGHLLLDLFATQALGERATLRAAVLNLADRTWWHASAVRGLASDDPLLPSLAEPGRSLVVSIDWNWQ